MAFSASPRNATIYFGYGSNLWLHQMAQRCPESRYLGIARLNGYRWNISPRGYANVVETRQTEPLGTEFSHQIYKTHQKLVHPDADWDPRNAQSLLDEDADTSSEDYVFGLVYSLSSADETRLDRNEGVPTAYTKEYLPTDFWAMETNASEPQWTDIEQKFEKRTMLVYIDRKRKEDSRPKKEYIYRMNMGIKDAIALGVPETYIENALRPFIPGYSDLAVETMAKTKALDFHDGR